MTDQERDQKINEMVRMILFENTLCVPNSDTKITFRVMGDLDDDACDFFISYLKLVKEYRCMRKPISIPTERKNEAPE